MRGSPREGSRSDDVSRATEKGRGTLRRAQMFKRVFVLPPMGLARERCNSFPRQYLIVNEGTVYFIIRGVFMAEAKENAVDLDYLAQVADNGFENMDAGDVATPLLLISQQLSGVVSEEKIAAGHFYNSVTGEDYGTSVRVIVCHHDKMWYEWKPNQGGLVGRYPVGGLEGVIGDKYTGMTHGENKVEEKQVYLVYLPDHPEAGFMVFASTGGNMKYLKSWNTQMMYLRTPSGKQAPVFAAVWSMSLSKDKNKAGNVFYSCNDGGKSSIKFDSWVSKEVYEQAVLPARQTATQALAIADMRGEDASAEASAEIAESSDF